MTITPSNRSSHPNVMISSTFWDLAAHRQAVIDGVLRLGFFAVGMEFDSAKSKQDVVASSFEMVDCSVAYVCVLGFRYGQVPNDLKRNPERLSLTELEFRRARERGLPTYVFLMSSDHPVTIKDVEVGEGNQARLGAFKDAVRGAGLICPEFSSVEALKSLVLQSLGEFKAELAQASAGPEVPSIRRAIGALDCVHPPKLWAIPDYVLGAEFRGRRSEIAWLDRWAQSSHPLAVVEAIGGTGKSALTWHWLHHRSPDVPSRTAGTMWYSFYEGGADMAEFARCVLAYSTQRPPKEFASMRMPELAGAVLRVLQAEPLLLVLDGIERVLVAYHRLDASQTRDDEVGGGLDQRACTRQADGDFLGRLVSAGPSKLLLSSRLLPTALTNRAGALLPGVQHLQLQGLQPEDAVELLTSLGVRGEISVVSRFLDEEFDNHPLLIAVIAGLVNNHAPAPGDFDHWLEDVRGGGALQLSKLDLSQRRTHILAAAFRGLERPARELLSRIAALSDAVHYDLIAGLSPFLPSPPPEPRDRFEQELISEVSFISLSENELRRALDGPDTARREALLAAARSTSWGEKQPEQELIAQVQRSVLSNREQAARELEYRTCLADYRASEDYRMAVPRLVAGLQTLQNRGLLSWDRQRNAYDLHPVVRGYAYDVLNDNERIDIGARIADHFQSKARDKFNSARTLAEVQQSIALFRALAQARRFKAACAFYQGSYHESFARTLRDSLEVPLVILTMLNPLFPDGFARPSVLAGESSSTEAFLTNEAAAALLASGKATEAVDAFGRCLEIDVSAAYLSDARVSLSNLALALLECNQIARSLEAKLLAHEIAVASKSPPHIARTHFHLMQHYYLTGQMDFLEAHRREFEGVRYYGNPDMFQLGSIEEFRCRSRLDQGTLTADDLEKAIAYAMSRNGRGALRGLYEVAGELSLAHGQFPDAAESFERALELARVSGMPSGVLEARFALVKAKLGQESTARDLSWRLRDQPEPPHVELAEVFSLIGENERAIEHAREGFAWAWADGPPHCRWRPLERCRSVFAALNLPEPVLRPYCSSKRAGLPLERELRRLITLRVSGS